MAFSPEQSKYLIVWTDGTDGTHSQIFGQFVSAAGGLVTRAGAAGGDPFAVSSFTAGQDINQMEPDLIYNNVKKTFIASLALILVPKVLPMLTHTPESVARTRFHLPMSRYHSVTTISSDR